MSEEAEESLLDYRRNVWSARIRRGEGQWNSGGGDGRERRLVHGTYGGFDRLIDSSRHLWDGTNEDVPRPKARC